MSSIHEDFILQIEQLRKEKETLLVLVSELKKEIAAHGGLGWIELQKTLGNKHRKLEGLKSFTLKLLIEQGLSEADAEKKIKSILGE